MLTAAGRRSATSVLRWKKVRYSRCVEYRENNQSHKELLSLTDEQERLRLQTIIGSAEIEIMHTREASLEEIFIKVTGRELI